jgi:hypothetical protein
MTGQVKEEILTRLGELGVKIADGCVSFAPTLLQANEFIPEPRALAYITPEGREASLALPGGSLGFTFCGTRTTIYYCYTVLGHSISYLDFLFLLP